jgi:hypothetical protein
VGGVSLAPDNALIENFRANTVNELTNNANGCTLTVVGTTTSPATSVTVNGSSASLFNDAKLLAGWREDRGGSWRN